MHGVGETALPSTETNLRLSLAQKRRVGSWRFRSVLRKLLRADPSKHTILVDGTNVFNSVRRQCIRWSQKSSQNRTVTLTLWP